ncbi:hypothetical protein [Candidatus Finniella inopinata]|uniref:Uncharacterized protein n=1 Tax=Candidatus Finniella inopinata TaxID=1696036 RepID=A0A4V2DZR1_9PROT|nr:hypothetical protein [Candidatus Finniella inopinata]RZI45937.1 hypothetical protein EQU50_05760 [Candidatus Finniella inopinata]
MAYLSLCQERYTNHYRGGGRPYVDDGDVLTLIDIMKSCSAEINRQACDLIKTIINTGPAKPERKLKLSEGLILYASDKTDMPEQLNRLRIYKQQLDLLTNYELEKVQNLSEVLKYLVAIMNVKSAEINKDACELAREFIFSSNLGHGEIIHLYEDIISCSIDETVRYDRLDELRFYYVDLLMDAQHVFTKGDLELLTRMAKNRDKNPYCSSFQALLAYVPTRNQRYLIHMRDIMRKSIREIIKSGRCLENFQYILGLDYKAREYDYVEFYINHSLKYVRNNRYINPERLEYLPTLFQGSPECSAKRELLILSDFLKKWYSVKVGAEVFTVPELEY